MDNKPYRQFNPVDSMSIARDAGTGGYQGGEANYESGETDVPHYCPSNAIHTCVTSNKIAQFLSVLS